MRNFALLLAVSSLASVLPSQLAAQSFRLRANIPFAFVMDGKTMPAGAYEISAGTILNGTVLVRNQNSNVAAMAHMMAPTLPGMTETDAAVLTFDRYGDRYFLAQISPGGGETGLELNTAFEEHKALKQETANRPEKVTVLAMR
jgi:hypothetical protein